MSYGLFPTASESLATSQPLIRANFSHLGTIINPTVAAEEHIVCGVGEIRMFGGAAAAVWKGWLICDGSAYSRTNASYAGLYSVIGTAYGVGDGALTFNVPSFCYVFVRGVAASPGATGGLDTHSNAISSLTATMSGSTAIANGDGNIGYGSTAGGGVPYTQHTHDAGTLSVALGGGTDSANNIPVYGTAIYIIKR